LQVLETFAEDMAVGDKRPEVAFRQQGNLFLVDTAGRAEAEQGLALQKSLGCQVEWLTPDDLAQRYPLLRVPNIVGGTLGRQDGTMDTYAVLTGYKNKAVALGAEFLAEEVSQLRQANGRISGVSLANGEKLDAPVVVNGAGAWANLLMETIGVPIPVQPVKREVYVLETEARPDGILPGIFFPSGLYLFHEREGHFMVGKSFDDDPVAFEFSWSRQRFEDRLWEELVENIPAFERLKVVRGWAGLYEVNTLDDNAILGEHPLCPGIYLANGFSGHGFQQCHAVGRYLCELILGKPLSLDLSIFSAQRILDNKPVFESASRII
jgi:glycine/D-amino acid oxidase-like deaminating enzyme